MLKSNTTTNVCRWTHMEISKFHGFYTVHPPDPSTMARKSHVHDFPMKTPQIYIYTYMPLAIIYHFFPFNPPTVLLMSEKSPNSSVPETPEGFRVYGTWSWTAIASTWSPVSTSRKLSWAPWPLAIKMVNFMAIWSDFIVVSWDLPSGKLSHNYGKSPFFMGKSTISMVIFHSYVSLPEGNQTNMGIFYGIPFGNQTWLALVSWKIPGGWGTWRCFFGKIIYTWGIFNCHTGW